MAAATTTTTSKLRSDHQNLSRSKSLGTNRDKKTAKSPSSSSEHNAEISERKPEKAVPNYLKPTISSKGEAGKLQRKGNNNNSHGLDDTQKLIRRRSFDRPPSSLSSPPSTSSPRLQKSLNISPRRHQDRPSVPREKPVTTPRSVSFHANRSSPRGATTVKSPPVASRGPKKSGLSTKSEVSSANISKKAPDSETSKESPSVPVQEEEEEKEVVKVVATQERQVPTLEGQVADAEEALLKSEDKVEPMTEAVQLQPDEPSEEKMKESEETFTSPVPETGSVDATNAEEAANDDQNSRTEKCETDEQKGKEAEEEKAPEDNQENRGPEVRDISTDVATDLKVATCVGETTGDQKKEGDKEKEEESSDTKEEEESKTPMTNGVSPQGTECQVVQGKKESPSAYNDVIEKTASKLLENRKNKVKALVGAFETVIDYETPAPK